MQARIRWTLPFHFGMHASLCGKNGEDLTLLSANHKDLGQIMVCEECWKKLWNKNRMVCGTTGSGGTCPSCR